MFPLESVSLGSDRVIAECLRVRAALGTKASPHRVAWVHHPKAVQTKRPFWIPSHAKVEVMVSSSFARSQFYFKAHFKNSPKLIQRKLRGLRVRSYPGNILSR